MIVKRVKHLTRQMSPEQLEMVKVALLAIIFFLIIGSYSLVRELKDLVFTSVIGTGRRYWGYAKIFSVFTLIPTLFLHSKLVDQFKRHQLIYIYSTLFAILGIVCAFFLGHPTIGLANTLSSPYRIFGWAFYMFVEAYSPLVVSVFWAFMNSITKPEKAPMTYTRAIAGSKIGGMLTTVVASYYFAWRPGFDVANHQLLLIAASLILIGVPAVLYLMLRVLPEAQLHGYEAAYKAEKKQKQPPSLFQSLFSGLILLFRYPYVLGIFGMRFFFELVNQTVKVENIIFGKSVSTTLSGFSSFLLWQAFLVHLVGFFVVVFGTRALLELLGERRSLMLVPTLTGLSVIGFIINKTYLTAVIAFVVTRAVNYAFAEPLREALYIPTIKAIKFKTKSWIDGVGSKFAKMCASSYTMSLDWFSGMGLLTPVHSVFFALTVSLWFGTAYSLGRRYEHLIEHNDVVGS